MTRFLSAVLVTVLFGLGARAADDKDVKAVLDKAIKALGGEEKLAAIKAVTWKSKGKVKIGDDENPFTGQATMQGLDQYRSEFNGEFMGNQVKGVVVLNGDKGWRQFADMTMELDKDGIANEKRSVYLQLTPVTLMPLKGKGFKVEAAKGEKVGGKPAVGVKVTAPDGKDFTLYFDEESGLPVKQVAKVVGFMGDEATQETTFGNYKTFDGIKKATKIESKRNGERFVDAEVTEFKVLKKVDPKTFEEPK